MPLKNSNDTIVNRTPDLPACSAVPQPTTPPRVHSLLSYNTLLFLKYFETYLRLSVSSNINISLYTNVCVLVLCPGYSAGIKTWKRALWCYCTNDAHRDWFVYWPPGEICGQNPPQEKKWIKATLCFLWVFVRKRKRYLTDIPNFLSNRLSVLW